MHNRMILVMHAVSIAIFLLLPAKVLNAETVEEIKILYNHINQVIKKSETKKIFLFANASENSRKKWSIRDNESTDIFKKSQYKAEVHLYSSRVIKAIITVDSKAGDWVNTKEYYYYDNANIAFIFESHLTYVGYDFDQDKNLPPGPFIIEKRSYFDKKMHKVKYLEKAYIYSTKAEIPVRFLNQVDFDEDIDYKKVQLLPFFDLIKSQIEKK